VRGRLLSGWAGPAVVFLAAGLVGAVFKAAAADEPAAEASPPPVSFYKDIRPILQDHCQGCHQPAKRSGGLLLTSFAEMQQGGDTQEPIVLAGQPDASLLVQYITPRDGQPPLMPQDAEPLTPAQIELIRRWIAEGAADDTPQGAQDAVDMEHPPVYRLPPVITSLDFSPDDALLAVSGYHEVLLWRADGSALEARLVGLAERIESAVFSPDGKYLAVTGGSPARFGEVQVWDVAQRKLLLSHTVTYDTLYGASWSSDGKWIAFGCADNTVRAIEAATGKQVLYQGAHNDWVLDTVFSTDNSHLVSVSRDRSMKLTEVATERFVDNITSITPGALKGGLMSVDRHPTRDELLIGGSDGEPKIYQMYRTRARQIGDDFNRIERFKAQPLAGRIFSVCYSADGTRVAVGASNVGTGELRVLAEADGSLISRCDTVGPVYAVAFRHDGTLVAAAGFDGLVRLVDPNSGQVVKEFVPVPIATEEPVAAAP
jgi:WD40 repeat protein/mono/diheme cytochrome c family protein